MDDGRPVGRSFSLCHLQPGRGTVARDLHSLRTHCVIPPFSPTGSGASACLPDSQCRLCRFAINVIVHLRSLHHFVLMVDRVSEGPQCLPCFRKMIDRFVEVSSLRGNLANNEAAWRSWLNARNTAATVSWQSMQCRCLTQEKMHMPCLGIQELPRFKLNSGIPDIFKSSVAVPCLHHHTPSKPLQQASLSQARGFFIQLSSCFPAEASSFQQGLFSCLNEEWWCVTLCEPARDGACLQSFCLQLPLCQMDRPFSHEEVCLDRSLNHLARNCRWNMYACSR